MLSPLSTAFSVTQAGAFADFPFHQRLEIPPRFMGAEQGSHVSKRRLGRHEVIKMVKRFLKVLVLVGLVLAPQVAGASRVQGGITVQSDDPKIGGNGCG